MPCIEHVFCISRLHISWSWIFPTSSTNIVIWVFSHTNFIDQTHNEIYSFPKINKRAKNKYNIYWRFRSGQRRNKHFISANIVLTMELFYSTCSIFKILLKYWLLIYETFTSATRMQSNGTFKNGNRRFSLRKLCHDKHNSIPSCRPGEKRNL